MEKHWDRLDNAAKIFPASTNSRDTKVFRFACELYENVECDVLQKALDNTIIGFPNFCVVMKRGAFWYYLERSEIRPVIREEYKRPCGKIYDRDVKKLLFEVTYFKKRINLEVYHTLTDGTGAVQFLKTLVVNYITLKHKEEFKNVVPEIDYDASIFQKRSDSFQKYYDKNSKKTSKLKYAYKLKGEKIDNNSLKIIEGIIPLDKALEIAHQYKCSLTALIGGIFVKAVYDEMDFKDKSKSINLDVPVNLRKYFESASSRNFFAVMNFEYKGMSELKEFIDYTGSKLKKELTQDELKKRMNALISVEKNIGIKFVPLFIKNIVLNLSVKIAEMGETISLSNVGAISMPKEVESYIKMFDMMVSTSGMQACMCSYENNLVLTFSSVFKNTEIQKRVFRTLSELGLEITVEANVIDEGT